MLGKLKGGNHIAITPDGPKGPAEEAKFGAVKLASMSGAKIIPVAFNASSKWTLGSWDAMFIPKPFSNTVLLMGESYSVKSNLSKIELAEETHKLNSTLKGLNERVQQQLLS